MLPPSMLSRWVIVLSSVVLPDPLGPIRKTTLPCSTSSETPLITFRPWKDFSTFSMVTSAAIPSLVASLRNIGNTSAAATGASVAAGSAVFGGSAGGGASGEGGLVAWLSRRSPGMRLWQRATPDAAPPSGSIRPGASASTSAPPAAARAGVPSPASARRVEAGLGTPALEEDDGRGRDQVHHAGSEEDGDV